MFKKHFLENNLKTKLFGVYKVLKNLYGKPPVNFNVMYAVMQIVSYPNKCRVKFITKFLQKMQ